MNSNFSLMKKGDKIGLITPAGFITQEKLDITLNNIKNLDLQAVYSSAVLNRVGYLAGNDFDRANDLHKMYQNKDIKAILCIRGGYGTTRILDLIDFDIIKQNPKPLIGYSDITALLSAIYKQTNIPGFHGIVGASILSEYSKECFKKIFFNTNYKVIIETSKKNSGKSYVINSGKTNGILIGGNLSLLVSLLGTNYDINWDDKIIFLEEVNEPPYKIDRMLTQLHLAGKFKNVKGIILGTFKKCDMNDFEMNEEVSLSLQEVLEERLKHLKIPTVYGFSFGHIKEQAIFPFGIRISFDTNSFQLSFNKDQFKDFF